MFSKDSQCTIRLQNTIQWHATAGGRSLIGSTWQRADDRDVATSTSCTLQDRKHDHVHFFVAASIRARSLSGSAESILDDVRRRCSSAKWSVAPGRRHSLARVAEILSTSIQVEDAHRNRAERVGFGHEDIRGESGDDEGNCKRAPQERRSSTQGE